MSQQRKRKLRQFRAFENQQWYRNSSPSLCITGFVYLVEDADRPGLFKIGMTTALASRLRDYARAMRIRFVWYIASNNACWLERYLMTEWRLLHDQGEWFRLTDREISQFKSVRLVNWKQFEPIEYEPLFPREPHLNHRYRIEVGELVEKR